MRAFMKNLEKNESTVIKKLLDASETYCDPRADKDHSQSLRFEINGVAFRKFIVDFKYEDPKLVKRKNVRDGDYDPAYIRETLTPLIKAQGLRYVPHVDLANCLETGHNRIPTLETLYPGQKLPFLVTSPPYVEHPDGTYEKTDGTVTRLADHVARIKSNPPPVSNPYNMKSVAIQIKDAYDLDNSFLGLNPSGEWFQVNEGPFDTIMDDLHPNQFKSKSARTKIRLLAGKGRSIIKPVEFRDWTHAATSKGWPAGVKTGTKNPLRMAFVEWVDPVDQTNITTVSTNGNKLREKVSLELLDMYLNDTLSTCKGVKLLMKINSPQQTPQGLNSQRRDFIQTKIDPLNAQLKNKNWPTIKEVFWVKQLNAPLDTGLHFKVGKNQHTMSEKK